MSAPRDAGSPPTRTTGPARPVRVVAAICVVGLVLTGLATWAASRADRNAEERLLEGQTQQAAAVLSTAVLNIQQPLTAALDVEAAGPDPGGAAFERIFSRNVGEDRLFVSA